jgi:hypothetical protein
MELFFGYFDIRSLVSDQNLRVSEIKYDMELKILSNGH